MWTILEEHEAKKVLDKLPPQVASKYSVWYATAHQLGPAGLRALKSFHDEKLSGRMAHLRSSRLSLQWRVIYAVKADVMIVRVVEIVPHVYK
jgi:plasmid maintenance system killer protein